MKGDMAVEVDQTERLVETWDEAAFLARLDHDLLVGQEITLKWIFNCEGDDACGKFIVRLLPASRADLEHTIDEFIDPYWDIEPVCDESKKVFARAKDNNQWVWSAGSSYRVLERYDPKYMDINP
jgi:hypothetical protein